MKENKIESDTIIMIDVPFLNSVIKNLKKHFEMTLNRPLQKIDLSDLLVYFALDGGVEKNGKSVQVVLIYDEGSPEMYNCVPADLKRELHNVAFMDEIGEFILNSYQPEMMVNREDLYVEFLKVLLDAEEVNRYILIPSVEEYGDRIRKLINTSRNKAIVQFCLKEPEIVDSVTYELVAYPIMQALGIRGDELN